MKRVEPNIDAYGNLARASFFADYIELLALGKRRNRKALLEDLIADSFAQRQQITFEADLPARVDGDDWTPVEYADAAWICFEERLEALGDLYPFRVEADRLSVREDVILMDSPYVAVLSIAIGHAFASDKSLKIEDWFEELVGDVLVGRGLLVGRVGSSFRGGGDFRSTMAAVGEQLGFATFPDATSRRVNANDAGVDLVAHLDWFDGRNWRWLFVGQVTCGASDSWEAKLLSPVPLRWRKFLGDRAAPVPFLALPFHVDDAAGKLLEDTERHIFDRLRLVRNLGAIPTGVLPIMEAVLAADIQGFNIQ